MFTLYILVRSDLSSLNPGKAAAQVAHAANKCVFDINNSDTLLDALSEWEGEEGFGTCVVLNISSGDKMRSMVDEYRNQGICCGIVTDHSYPLRDGDFTHHLPVETCAYFFGHKNVIKPLLEHLPLMR